MSKKLTRSIRLRKYETIYKKIVNSDEKKNDISKVEKKDIEKKVEKKKKNLNSYQKFVKEESKREKYNNMRSDDRLKAIAIAWKKYCLKLKKKLKN